jgi:tRNA threonylcarbamoyladenosine biosynthesis protein TsaB
MTILGLDTTGEFGSIALVGNGEILAEAHLHSPEGFAHILFGELAAVLERAGCRLEHIDCFAAASGPGSFTGVRVGLTAIKGLAEATEKPVAAISNLRALAASGSEDRRAVLLDARRGDIYAAVYDSGLTIVEPEVVVKLPLWLESLDGPRYEFVTVAGAPFEAAVAGTRFAAMTWTQASRFLAPAVVRCAEQDARDGKLISALAADANYVRSSDAELFWRDK